MNFSIGVETILVNGGINEDTLYPDWIILTASRRVFEKYIDDM